MIDLKELIESSKKLNNWDLGNEVLYNLCKEHPTHKEPNEIIAKIWLIGRAYSASIERRKVVNPNEDFWDKNVLPKIKNSPIDIFLDKCRNSNDINDFLKAHKNVTDLFKDISGLNKRSLASKYLHFHIPDKFYIYDSIAVNSTIILQNKLKIDKVGINKTSLQWDHQYSKFYQKCFYFKHEIKNKYEIDLNCRQFDNLLMEIARNH